MSRSLGRRDLLKAGVAGATAVALAGDALAQATNTPYVPTGPRAPSGRYDTIATCWIHMGATVPFSGRMWSPVSFEHRARHVAAAGFKGLGLFHDDLAHILENEAPGSTQADKLKWVKDVLDRNGLVTNETEFLVNWMLPLSDPRRQAEQPIREMLFQAANILKPRHMKVGNLGIPVPAEEANKHFLQLCEEFAPTGTLVAMELLPPDQNSQTIAKALSVVNGARNGGIFLDTWHMNNIPGISYQDIAGLKPGQVVGVELDDGWLVEQEYQQYFAKIGAPGFIELTVNCRKCCGEGNFDVVGFIKAVAASGYQGPWGNEILSEELRRLPMEMAVRHVYRTSLPHLKAALEGTALPGPAKRYS